MNEWSARASKDLETGCIFLLRGVVERRQEAGIAEPKPRQVRRPLQYRMTYYIFSWDTMLSFRGSTAPYLQNAYVGIQSSNPKNPRAAPASPSAKSPPGFFSAGWRYSVSKSQKKCSGNSGTETTSPSGMNTSGSLEQLKERLLFPAAVVAVGVAAFAVGYQNPRSAPATAAKVAPAEPAPALGDRRTVVHPSTAIDQAGLQVEGFGKIGFAEAEELLTTASPEQREKWAQELYALGDKPVQRIALIAFYSAWLDLDPEAALRSLQKYPDILHRGDLLSSLSAASPPARQPKLIAIISTWSEREQRYLFPELLVRLAETDPAATAEFIDSHPTQVSDSDAAALISAWAMDDAGSAARWLDASSYSSNGKVFRLLVDSWLTKDPVAAENYVVAHRQNEGVEEAAVAVALHLYEASPDQAREFVRLFDSERASTLRRSLAESSTDDQLAGIVDWLATFPGHTEDVSLENAFARYYSADSPQALNWLRSQTAERRDNLLAVAILSQPGTPSLDLFSLANQIGDAQKRDRALSLLVQSFTGENMDGREQIRGLGLPPLQTRHLLNLYATLTNDAEANNNH